MAETAIASLTSEFGCFSIEATETHITAVHWSDATRGAPTPLLIEALSQMQAYFSGTLHRFDVPLAPNGTAFEKQVYAAISAIPHGQTRTYGDLSRSLAANPQAVGQACGSNPIPIIIPCHRVTAANGLGGFSSPAGVEQKVALLRHEGAYGLLL